MRSLSSCKDNFLNSPSAVGANRGRRGLALTPGKVDGEAYHRLPRVVELFFIRSQGNAVLYRLKFAAGSSLDAMDTARGELSHHTFEALASTIVGVGGANDHGRYQF